MAIGYLSDEDMKAQALAAIGNCQYLYTAKQSDEQKEHLAELLPEGEDWEEKTLYRITNSDGAIEWIKVDD